MKRTCFLLLLAIFFGKCFAQGDSERKLFLKIEPLALFNPFTFPTVQFSLEKELPRRISIIPEFGMQLYNLRSTVQDTSFINPKGFKIGVEGRWYGLFKRVYGYKRRGEPSAEKYVALSVFYRQNRNNTQINYLKPNDPVTYTDCFVVNKKALGANLIFGIQLRSPGRIIFEFYGGGGLLIRHNKNTYLEYNNLLDQVTSGPSVIDFPAIKGRSDLQENSGVIGNVILGIRLGLRL